MARQSTVSSRQGLGQPFQLEVKFCQIARVEIPRPSDDKFASFVDADLYLIRQWVI